MKYIYLGNEGVHQTKGLILELLILSCIYSIYTPPFPLEEFKAAYKRAGTKKQQQHTIKRTSL